MEIIQKLLINKTNAKVYAFEPMEKSFEELKKLKELYKDRFFIEKIALGNEDKLNKFIQLMINLKRHLLKKIWKNYLL